jgi:hypothetical protein
MRPQAARPGYGADVHGVQRILNQRTPGIQAPHRPATAQNVQFGHRNATYLLPVDCAPIAVMRGRDRSELTLVSHAEWRLLVHLTLDKCRSQNVIRVRARRCRNHADGAADYYTGWSARSSPLISGNGPCASGWIITSPAWQRSSHGLICT